MKERPNKQKTTMAKLENKIITFIFKWEAGLKPEFFDLPIRDQFDQAKKTGFVQDPADSGGATMVGVTIATFKEYCRRMKRPTPNVATLKAITFDDWLGVAKMFFWNRWKADKIESTKVAFMLFDWVWASGINGIKRPQRILGVGVDGLVGPKTLDSVNHADPESLFVSLCNARADYYNEIIHSSIANYERRIGRKATQKELLKYTKLRFKAGWFNRLNDMKNWL